VTTQPDYIKYIYWFTPEEEEQLRERLLARGIRLKSAKGIVCTPLDPINKITSVPPEVWDDTCGRQGSWYRASDKSGLYLVVSAFELEDQADHLAAVLTLSDFVPPRRATTAEKEQLVDDPQFQAKLPEGWKHPTETERRIYLRWARRFGSSTDNYAFLYLSHTANHANFVCPRFFIEDESGTVPYSIDATAHSCSCCVELFQILGQEYARKLVLPCPGAAIFARLEPDRYLLVARPEARGD